jgi:transcriptional regulator with XRE-family HTH domain
MGILTELATSVKQRRAEMNLSQEQLAALAELSRVTVNSLENGKLRNLSLLKAEKLANAIGLGLGVTGMRSSREGKAIDTAARTASVSYGQGLPADVLEDALLNGVVPPGYIPQLRAVLDETPLAVLSDVAAELEREHGVRRRSTWQRMRTLASVLKAQRGIWN